MNFQAVEDRAPREPLANPSRIGSGTGLGNAGRDTATRGCHLPLGEEKLGCHPAPLDQIAGPGEGYFMEGPVDTHRLEHPSGSAPAAVVSANQDIFHK